MSLQVFLDLLNEEDRYGADISYKKSIKRQRSQYATPNPPLPENLQGALKNESIKQLYSHQVDGLNLVRDGKNVVVVTPTASGKTYVYLLPILERIIREPETRVLLLFPLKALAQDQLKRIRSMIAAMQAEHISAAIYDGDTPRKERQTLRENPPNLLLTNPDMLHQGFLPFHSSWEPFFRDLKFVVLDELHTYKGIFGSHVLQIMHRLRRITLFYHSNLQFIATSATIKNPAELAENLTGVPFEAVEKSGAPSAGRKWIFVNPHLSLYTTACKMLGDAIDSGLKTIVFTKARKVTELIHQWTVAANPDLAGRISAYRSGYLPSERREIERQLRDGEVDAVVSTSALEMGIDIGGLDVCILVGYPGTIATTWQRAGRVGRKERDSAAVMIAMPDALDQYYMRHPEDFFRRDAEAAVVDGANRYLLKNHLLCAAQELPLRRNDSVYDIDSARPAIEELVEEDELSEAAGGFLWFSNRKQPQRNINIRGSGQTVSILEKNSRRLIGSVSGWQALSECHPGAVYLHRGKTYVIQSLDLAKQEAWASQQTVPYYTVIRSDKETEILETLNSRQNDRFKVSLGKLKVTEWVTGYERRATRGRDKISEHTLDLPPMIYETVGLWIEPVETAIAGLIEEKYHPMGSLHALEHASLALMPLFALCDRNDMGGISFTRHQQTKGATVFFYDGYPGGVGLANRAYEVFDELLNKVYALVNECPCDDGCPSCIHSPKCGHGNIPLDKAGTIRLLEHLSGGKELRGNVLPEEPGQPEMIITENTGQEKGLQDQHTKTSTQETAIKKYTNRLPLAENRDIVVFDVETQKSAQEVGGWHNAHMMRVSLAVLYERKTGSYHTYLEDRIPELIGRLKKADLVVGFNNIRFDNAVLSIYTEEDLRSFPTLDLLAEITRQHGFRVSLSNLATATFNVGKLGDGLDALQWWKEGKIDLIEKYCKMDVELTAKLLNYALEHGYVLRNKQNAGNVKLPLILDM